ncbi:MAG: hypothetical protein ACI89L_002589 [Phycisphaerales bacterium]|jgi:hypothetical protein
MIPSTFSLFPLAADEMIKALGPAFFASLDHPSDETGPGGPLPAVAPTQSELLLGLDSVPDDADRGAAGIRFHHGRLTAHLPARPSHPTAI